MSLTFKLNGESRSVTADRNATLAELSAAAGFPLNLQCGGQGACRGCQVKLGEGVYCINGKQAAVSAGETLEARACKTSLLSETAEVTIPERSLLKIGECSSADFYATRENLFVPRDDVEGQLGIAVDIGTTTVAALLVDLSTGKILARESAYNRQIELADNIASRIALCADIENAGKLQKLVIEKTISPMINKLFGQNFQGSETSSPSEREALCRNAVAKIVFSGNTVMCHLALGLSPLCIGTIPFEPLTKVYSEHIAPALGLDCCPNATVRTVPSIAGYVGGDVVCDLYISEPSAVGVELLVDIGTNGEIVLCDHGKLTATATAAGPAFEGAGLLHGCRAAEGVIEAVVCRADDSIEVETIGGKPATGLCGSAAVDFIATALRTGLINKMGRFDLDRLEAAGRLVKLDCHGMIVNACVLVPQDESGLDEAVLITEFDISQILKAKAAVYAGIRTLLKMGGHSLADLDRFILAGGFAAHLKLENAITIGLLPELPLSRFDVVGNGSLAGAYAALGDSQCLPRSELCSATGVWKELQQISEKPDTCHLAETRDFEDGFIDALALPHMDPDEFPQTAKKDMYENHRNN